MVKKNMASKKIKIHITLNDTKIQKPTQKNYQMCTNTKIHGALLKTKAQTIAKMKYLVHKNPKKKKKKNRIISIQITLIQQHCNKKIEHSPKIITIINQEQIKIITIYI